MKEQKLERKSYWILRGSGWAFPEAFLKVTYCKVSDPVHQYGGIRAFRSPRFVRGKR